MSVLTDAGARKKSEKPGTEFRKVMMGRELGVQGCLAEVLHREAADGGRELRISNGIRFGWKVMRIPQKTPLEWGGALEVLLSLLTSGG
jgi:hypothetical protein